MIKTMAEMVYMRADSTIISITMQDGEFARTRYLDSTSLNGLNPKLLVALKVRLRIRIVIISVVSTVMATERE
jgi:hypothetical protein